MIAERNFVTDDHSMLSFNKGDIIRLQVMDGLQKGDTLYLKWKSCYHINESMTQARVCVCVCFSLSVSSRSQLWLRGEEEGGVFGGAEERH